MTKDKTVTMSRELAERILLRIDQAASAFKVAKPERNELRALLAAPVVERQEPVGRVSYIGSGFVRVRTTECLAMEQPLYTSPPAPVALVLSDDDLTEIAQKAAFASTHRYAYLPAHSDSTKYFKPHRWVIDAMRACLDKVKEMNR